MRHFGKLIGGALIIFSGASTSFAAAPLAAIYGSTPSYDWSGPYLGAAGGYGWGTFTTSDASGAVTGPTVPANGFVATGTLGWNFLLNNNFVLGVEADISNGPSGSRPKGTTGSSLTCGSGACYANVEHFETARLRAGWTNGPFLIYATGGFAAGKVSGGVHSNGFNEGTATVGGWAAGAGIEYALRNSLTAKLEYMHVDLGEARVGVSATYLTTPLDVVRAGLNWHFGGPAN